MISIPLYYGHKKYMGTSDVLDVWNFIMRLDKVFILAECTHFVPKIMPLPALDLF